jgi:hypothetical protein
VLSSLPAAEEPRARNIRGIATSGGRGEIYSRQREEELKGRKRERERESSDENKGYNPLNTSLQRGHYYDNQPSTKHHHQLPQW